MTVTVGSDRESTAGHVLIIEDDETMRVLETLSLQRSGWVVSEASAGRERWWWRSRHSEVRCRAPLRVSRQQRLLVRSEHELRVLTENTTELVVRCGLDGVNTIRVTFST